MAGIEEIAGARGDYYIRVSNKKITSAVGSFIKCSTEKIGVLRREVLEAHFHEPRR